MGRIQRKLFTLTSKVLQRVDPPAADPEVKPEPSYLLFMDGPSNGTLDSRDITVGGWIVPEDDTKIVAVRAVNGGNAYDLSYGMERQDVAAKFPDMPVEVTLYSGFSADISFSDGPLDIEVDFGEGFKQVHSIVMQHSTEKLVSMLYDPEYSLHWAEHQNLLANKKAYYYEEPLQNEYKRHEQDPRLVAFYLPQFHPIKENDEVWGKGFTEWTNVTAAQPRFVGHQQPILPKDLGFYDLRLDQTIKDQIDMARHHGVYGFCFYYYWFSGYTLLETPLQTFLKHHEWDFNFTICWANENWTKRWDGLDNDIIVAQKHAKDDPLNFIKSVEHILLDPRYIREDGKPVLIVYRASDLQKPALYAKVWREYFRKQHSLELHIVSVLGFDLSDPREFGFDAGIEFPPLTTVIRKDVFKEGELPLVDVKGGILDRRFEGGIVDYRSIIRNKALKDGYDFPVYPGVMPSWDNEARKKGKGASFHMVTPDLYASWLNEKLQRATNIRSDSLLFINAWNEWAEGALLEPTAHNGRAVLNRTTEMLATYSKDPANRKAFPAYGLTKPSTGRLAVVVHAFYAEEWHYIDKRLEISLKNTPYDLFVTVGNRDDNLAGAIKQAHPNARVYVVPNRGRDVLPFVFLARRLEEAGYEYVLKLHTKKSMHRTDGKEWFEGLINDLLPGQKRVKQIVDSLVAGTAMVGPASHYVSLERYIGSNGPRLNELLTDAFGVEKAQSVESGLNDYGYFASTMFWARMDALKPVLSLYLMPEDFEPEQRQIDGTTAHAIERLFGVASTLADGQVMSVSKEGGLQEMLPADATTEYPFAP